jgi:hypothetical protein
LREGGYVSDGPLFEEAPMVQGKEEL